MAIKHYLKYVIPHKEIYNEINAKKYKRINFYIDLASISRGFFSKTVIKLELGNYVSSGGKMPTIFISELKEFLNNLYRSYKQYNPKFVLFIDEGGSIQNVTVDSTYKEGRGNAYDAFMLATEEIELFKQIKKYYFKEICTGIFDHKGLSTIINLGNYESDLVSEFVLANGYIDSDEPDTFNVTVSSDKDLLQVCRFNNSVQAISVYRKSKKQLFSHIFNDIDAITFLHNKFLTGILTSEYIPLILALAGDKADDIKGLRGIGYAKAIKLIMTYDLPPEITPQTDLPEVLDINRQLIYDNFRMTSFKSQITRLNPTMITKVKSQISDIFHS